MTSLTAHQRDFTERVLDAGKRALGGAEVWPWLEEQVESVARLGRQRSYIAFNARLRNELHIATDIKRPEYRQLEAHGKPKGWSGSIGLSEGRHKVSVIRANGLEHIRALEAHEFGHALLQRNPHFWHAISRNALLVDRCIERIVDDVGRMLLLPPSLLHELIGLPAIKADSEEFYINIWKMLPAISRATITPIRNVASRMALELVDHRAILFCYALPHRRAAARQGSLFDELKTDADPAHSGRKLKRVTASVPWMMLYRRHPEKQRGYMFADRVGAPRKVVLSDEQLSEAAQYDTGVLDGELVRKLAGRHGWSMLEGGERFWRIGSSLDTNRELHLVLCI